MGGSVKTAEQIVSSDQTFGVLFILVLIIVFYYIRQLINDAKEERMQNREDSREREAALMTQLGRSNDTLEEISRTQANIHTSLSDIQKDVGKLEDRFDNQFDDIWDYVKHKNFRELNLTDRRE
ncbi:hypothetical protein [Bacillus sp. es.036]|jgi:predicted nuclease with TOPRIM domain|uniref:hypothetical protein n=1 Tax=Bacillus sp. es.036 TaxID=1761764 RepID=UPI000BF7DC07|nr:hypothetical protein [Bacillus sp. es.036]PFG13077.1 hypothetical protein ATG70_1266 [Bacillus sp. es.036]